MSTITPAANSVLGRTAYTAKECPPQSESAPQESPVSRDKASRLLRYGSVVPVIGGAFETMYGMREVKLGITNDEKRDGKIDVVRGSSALVGSLANAPIYGTAWGIVHMASPVLATLGLIGGVANTVNAIFDGGRDIYNGVKGLKAHDPHAKSDIAWGAVKLGAGVLVAVGSFCVSPAFLYAGNIVFAAAAGIQNRKQLGHFLHNVGDKVGNVAHSVASHLHSRPLENEA